MPSNASKVEAIIALQKRIEYKHSYFFKVNCIATLSNTCMGTSALIQKCTPLSSMNLYKMLLGVMKHVSYYLGFHIPLE